MNASANKESEDGVGQMQLKKVETVGFYTSAGQGQEQVRRVQVVHDLQPQPALGPNTSGAILSNAAASVASTLQSAKDTLQRK
ncbi:hypothetical protein C2S52_009306 [Perilla frutescens var. hirtella]|uniref:Uncharacterized protein n=1 Tax=Perilla frutescens var. hirtella TaxID=608512 RepID=A0AAD4IXT5_PERFH|nr:hypothetical protein C2S51_017193 [Perilla frutescens var. frutescens]KAH6784347.1 hypothetical protein C2S52_009306 [Perilla frutescens var. hirtella]KAH6823264.1 hypothetical protein C2S53_009059 [Perilla frutescens var. hirtella]